MLSAKDSSKRPLLPSELKVCQKPDFPTLVESAERQEQDWQENAVATGSHNRIMLSGSTADTSDSQDASSKVFAESRSCPAADCYSCDAKTPSLMVLADAVNNHHRDRPHPNRRRSAPLLQIPVSGAAFAEEEQP